MSVKKHRKVHKVIPVNKGHGPKKPIKGNQAHAVPRLPIQPDVIDPTGTDVDDQTYDTQDPQLFKSGGKIPIKKYGSGGNVGGLFDTNRVAYVDSVLNANKNLDWVKRLYDKTPQNIPTPKDIKGWKPGQTSTHLMSDDGKGYVFPSVVNINGKLQYLGDRAEDYARETNTGIQLDSVAGTWFANNGYKTGTGVTIGKADGGLVEQSMNTNYKNRSIPFGKIMNSRAAYFADGGIPKKKDTNITPIIPVNNIRPNYGDINDADGNAVAYYGFDWSKETGKKPIKTKKLADGGGADDATSIAKQRGIPLSELRRTKEYQGADRGSIRTSPFAKALIKHGKWEAVTGDTAQPITQQKSAIPITKPTNQVTSPIENPMSWNAQMNEIAVAEQQPSGSQPIKSTQTSKKPPIKQQQQPTMSNAPTTQPSPSKSTRPIKFSRIDDVDAGDEGSTIGTSGTTGKTTPQQPAGDKFDAQVSNKSFDLNAAKARLSKLSFQELATQPFTGSEITGRKTMNPDYIKAVDDEIVRRGYRNPNDFRHYVERNEEPTPAKIQRDIQVGVLPAIDRDYDKFNSSVTNKNFDLKAAVARLPKLTEEELSSQPYSGSHGLMQMMFPSLGGQHNADYIKAVDAEIKRRGFIDNDEFWAHIHGYNKRAH